MSFTQQPIDRLTNALTSSGREHLIPAVMDEIRWADADCEELLNKFNLEIEEVFAKATKAIEKIVGESA